MRLNKHVKDLMVGLERIKKIHWLIKSTFLGH